MPALGTVVSTSYIQSLLPAPSQLTKLRKTRCPAAHVSVCVDLYERSKGAEKLQREWRATRGAASVLFLHWRTVAAPVPTPSFEVSRSQSHQFYPPLGLCREPPPRASERTTLGQKQNNNKDVYNDDDCFYYFQK